MAAVADGTPRLELMDCTINGERYHVATPEWLSANKVGQGARAWDVGRASDQGVDTIPFRYELSTFHEGAGFTFAGIPGVYEQANKMDASTPGKVRSWAQHASTGTTATGNSVRGWTLSHGGALYVFKGRYALKYTPSATHKSTWALAATSADFGAGGFTGLGNNVAVAGRPARFKGVVYVPLVNTSTGALLRFWQLTTVGSPDTWTQGPNDAELMFRAFVVTKGILRAIDNTEVRSVSGDPMVIGNWAPSTSTAGYVVTDSTRPATDLQAWDRYLIWFTQAGFGKFDEDFDVTPAIPELDDAGLSDENGVGAGIANGYVVVPHFTGLIRWRPTGAYHYIGPDQEGGFELGGNTFWDRPQCVLSFGKYLFVGTAGAYVWMFTMPQGQRGPLVPHAVFQVSDVESMCVTVISGKSYLCLLSGGSSSTVYVWQLPQHGFSPANDPDIRHDVTGCSFSASRYYAPSRAVKKTYREIEFWLEARDSAGTATALGAPGLTIQAKVDEGAALTLTDSAGSVAAFLSTGKQTAYFPRDATAVGGYVQPIAVYAPSPAADRDVTIRDMAISGELHPTKTEVINATLVWEMGVFQDRTQMRRTVKQQKADLTALDGPNSIPVPFRDIWGENGYVSVEQVEFREIQFTGARWPTVIANVRLRVSRYE